VVTEGRREVKSSLSMAALEQFFWLSGDADAQCMLRMLLRAAIAIRPLLSALL
jgi:hypothetical protein